MSERFVLGAYWGARSESVERCADRLHKFLTGIRDSHQSLSHWYQKAASPKKSLQKSLGSFETQSLVRILLGGRNRENVNRTVSEDLGFHLEFWNGQKGDAQASVGLTCGLYWQSATPGISVSNCVVLDLPKDLGILASWQTMSQLLTVTAEAWQPDWAGVMSESSMLSRNFDAEVPFVDWMVYVPYKVEGVTEPAFVSELAGFGSIIVVRPNPPSVDDVESSALVSSIESVLK